jgi:hypothetical protein
MLQNIYSIQVSIKYTKNRLNQSIIIIYIYIATITHTY